MPLGPAQQFAAKSVLHMGPMSSRSRDDSSVPFVCYPSTANNKWIVFWGLEPSFFFNLIRRWWVRATKENHLHEPCPSTAMHRITNWSHRSTKTQLADPQDHSFCMVLPEAQLPENQFAAAFFPVSGNTLNYSPNQNKSNETDNNHGWVEVVLFFFDGLTVLFTLGTIWLNREPRIVEVLPEWKLAPTWDGVREMLNKMTDAMNHPKVWSRWFGSGFGGGSWLSTIMNQRITSISHTSH